MLPRFKMQLTSRKIGINRPSSSSTASKVLLHSNEQMQVDIRNMEALLGPFVLHPFGAADDYASGHLQMTMHNPDHGLIPDTSWQWCFLQGVKRVVPGAVTQLTET